VGFTMHRYMGLACALLTFPNLCTILESRFSSEKNRIQNLTVLASNAPHLLFPAAKREGEAHNTGSQNPNNEGHGAQLVQPQPRGINITVAATTCGRVVGRYIPTSRGV
jgi:hypothetical protein